MFNSDKQKLHYPTAEEGSSQPNYSGGYPGGPPPGGAAQYPGGGYPAPQGAYQGGQPQPPQGAYQGGAPPQGAYPAGAAPGYPGGQPTQGYPQPGPPQGGYQGTPPAGAYQGGGAPPAGAYQGGGAPPAGAYQGGGAPPAGAYQGGGAPPAGAPGAPPQGGGAPQYQGEMPGDDIDDNPNAAPQQATAPPLEKMDEISGYGNVGFNSAVLPPPSYDDAMKGPPPERQNISNVPTITEQDAREALLKHVAENCCYGKGAAENLKYLDLKSTSAFHYTLETFGEGRQTAWAYEPYTGQVIDGPMNGVAPGPWDMPAQASALFQNQKVEVEVPHTASVKPCHTCFSSGYIRCHRCLGRGRVRCTWCHGSGHRSVHRNGEHHRERCTWCHGNGRRRCDTCCGCGSVTCTSCQGYRQLKCYIKLTIMWTNHVVDHIVERTPLPDHLIRAVSGQTAFEETSPRVWPIQHFPDAEVNDASRNLIQQQQHPTERILQQRHRVRIVPVTQCIYKWKDKDSDYFVYGFEHKVHAPDYPQQCCCGCSIL
ncbi:protein SSUH2 homolog isoform X1 [Mizuhopecten yessoensis]|uniref:protein SSUH2 homolog isoform X1 n=1 Tax=Mizuhopecten yessoensis TaxID=6573 RepID=UPI000B45DFD2|nr:protein SSUH2 homolog isoform X1 [Mizuhopecten yessoensis]